MTIGRKSRQRWAGMVTGALLILATTVVERVHAQDMSVDVHFNQEVGPFELFMNSTGQASADFEIEENYQRNTIYIGSIPHDGIKYNRVHTLFNLVEVQNHWSGEPEYDWTLLDSALDNMVNHSLKPFFELMDFPKGSWRMLPTPDMDPKGQGTDFFEDFVHDTVVVKWKEFIADLAQHLIDRYGREEVRTWYFETCNEPMTTAIGYCWSDEMVGQVVHGDSLTPENTCAIMLGRKYDADEAGLHSVDSALRYGGTGGGMYDELLEHLTNEPNYFTGEIGTRADFLSLHHIKGGWQHSWGTALNTHTRLKNDYPSLLGTPIMHTEDDWYYPWFSQGGMRASANNAVMLATKMLVYQEAVREGDNNNGERINFALSSPDNGFLGFYGQRILMNQFNDVGKMIAVYFQDCEQCAQKIELVKTAQFNSYVLMSLLGNTHIEADGYASDGQGGWNFNNDYFNEAFATKDDNGRVAAMIVNTRRNHMYCEDYKKTVSVTFNDLPYDSAVLAHYRIDSAHSNTFAVWQRMGGYYTPSVCTDTTVKTDSATIDLHGPAIPTEAQLAELRRRQELEYLDHQPPQKVDVSGGTFTTEFTLPMPGVSLVVLAPKPDNPPAEVQGIEVTERSDAITDERHMMVYWDDLYNKNLRTYEVMYSESGDSGTYTRVNEADLLCHAFMHIKPAGSPDGHYKVRAVDYWGSPSQVSTRAVKPQRRPVQISLRVRGNRLHIHNPYSHPVRVSVFNALGRRELYTVVDAKKGFVSGSREGVLSTGIHYVRIRAMDGDGLLSRRIVVR